MEQFAAMLTKEDQCALVFILSHGGDGVLFGSDGDKVSVNYLLQQLDNTSCTNMKGKPKLVFLQSCQTSKYYFSTYCFNLQLC